MFKAIRFTDQRVCRLNANYWSGIVARQLVFDRIINEIVPGISGHYQNSHCIIPGKRFNSQMMRFVLPDWILYHFSLHVHLEQLKGESDV